MNVVIIARSDDDCLGIGVRGVLFRVCVGEVGEVCHY